jgi:hypothetical protein
MNSAAPNCINFTTRSSANSTCSCSANARLPSPAYRNPAIAWGFFLPTAPAVTGARDLEKPRGNSDLEHRPAVDRANATVNTSYVSGTGKRRKHTRHDHRPRYYKCCPPRWQPPSTEPRNVLQSRIGNVLQIPHQCSHDRTPLQVGCFLLSVFFFFFFFFFFPDSHHHRHRLKD